MKFALALLAPFLLMTCGIVEFLFPLEYPQRYIEREVTQAELIGKWKITSDSVTRVNNYFQQKDVKLWALDTPWNSISLREDGTCEVDLELSWSLNDEVLREPDAPATCTWRIDSILGYDEGGAFRHVPGLFVRFEHYNKEADMYNVYYSESYIVEENGELILWNFIGDSVSSFQDFKKASK
jgi:hypothetical protein